MFLNSSQSQVVENERRVLTTSQVSIINQFNTEIHLLVSLIVSNGLRGGYMHAYILGAQWGLKSLAENGQNSSQRYIRIEHFLVVWVTTCKTGSYVGFKLLFSVPFCRELHPPPWYPSSMCLFFCRRMFSYCLFALRHASVFCRQSG